MTTQDEQKKAGDRPDPLVRLKLDRIQTNVDGSRTIPDATGKGRAASVEEAPQLVLDEVFGRSLRFSGAEDAVELAGMPPQPEAGFALAIWLKPGQTQEHATVVSLLGDPTWWALRAAGHVEFIWRNGDTDEDWQKLVSPDRLAADAWTHAAVSVDAEQVRLFVNGTLAASQACEGGLPWSDEPALRLGHNATFEVDWGALQHTLSAPGVRTIAFSRHAFQASDRQVLAAGLTDEGGEINLWDAITGENVGSMDVQWETVSCLQFDRRGRLVVAGSHGIYLDASPYYPSYGRVYGYEPVDKNISFKPLEMHEGKGPTIKCLAYDGNTIWVASTDEDIYGFEEGEDEGTPWEIGSAVPMAYDHSSGRFLIALGAGVELVEFKNGQPLLTEAGGEPFVMVHDTDVIAIATCDSPIKTPQNQRVGWVTACEDGSVHLWGWNLDESGQVHGLPERLRDENGPVTPEGTHEDVVAVAFSPDGQTFVTASKDGYVWQWEATTGNYFRAADGEYADIAHGAPLTAVAYSPDGRIIATAGEDGTVRLWDAKALRREHANYHGDLSNLRLYASALTTDELETAILQDLPEIEVGTIFPLDFSLHNDQQQHVLYLTDEAQQLHLDVTNVGRRNVMLPAGNGNGKANGADDDPTESTLEIRFRPGTLKPESKIALAPPDADQAKKLGHVDDSANWELTQTRDADGSDVVHLVRKALASTAGNGDADAAATTLIPDETLYLTLGGLLANVSLGSHSTRVQLKYRLHYDDHTPLYGSRLHYLRLLNMSDSEVQKHVGSLLKDIETKAKVTYVNETVSTKVGEVRSSLDQKITGLGGSLDERIKRLVGRVATLEAKVSGDETAQAEFDKEQYHLMQREYYKEGGPLVAGLAGAPAVLNDGHSLNTLRLRIDNRDPYHQTHLSPHPNLPATFHVYLYDMARPAWSLLGTGDLESVQEQPKVSDGWQAQTIREEHSTSIKITQTTVTGPPENPEPFTPVELTFETHCSAPTGKAYIVIKYENVGETDENGKYFEGWLRVPIERTPILPHGDSTLASGSLNLVDNASLGFHHKDVQKGFDTSKPDSAISIDANGALQIASKDTIGLYPGATPSGTAVPVGTKGLVVKNDGNGAQVQATLDGGLNATGNIDAAGAISADSLTVTGDISVEGKVAPQDGLGSYLVPRGAIIMWHGDWNQVPEGWALCDGTNNTPDLRARFIVGVAAPDVYADYHRNRPGGSPQPLAPGLTPYTKGVNNDDGSEQVTLEMNHMPLHDHGWGDGPPEKPHTHEHANLSNVHHNAEGNSFGVWTPDLHTTKMSPATTGIDWPNVMHAEGGDQPHENRPPYFALYFIMKL